MTISEPGRVARISAISSDRMRLWLELTDGRAATVDSNSGPFTATVGTVVLFRENDGHLEAAPNAVWPTDAETRQGVGWVGVVKIRTDSVTVIDVGGTWRRVETTDTVPYEVGNTVEGNDSAGVTAVLDERPIRLFDAENVSDDVIESFVVETADEVSFDDFGGLPLVVARARELIELPLNEHDRLSAIGASPIRGVLFTGLPGTGKTMLAQIIASASHAKFYAVSGPTIFSKWYGESEQLLRGLFSHAAAHAPAIIFFDEIDSVAGRRDEDAHEASKRVVAQLLTLMDGLSVEHNVTVIAATNRPQDIDPALLRPGRFDWQIEFPLPDLADRLAMLRVGAQKVTTLGPLPHEQVAAVTHGWSAAELSAIWKEAALLAVSDSRAQIMAEDYLGAQERVAAQRAILAAALQRGES